MVVALQALTLVAEIATRFLQPYYLIPRVQIAIQLALPDNNY
jgi:hypothetical protein